MKKNKKIIRDQEIKKKEISPYQQIELKPRKPIIIKDYFLDVLEDKSEEYINFEKVAKIFLAQKGVGHKCIAIVTEPNENLPIGEIKLCLQFISYNKFVENIWSKLKNSERKKLLTPFVPYKEDKFKLYAKESGQIPEYIKIPKKDEILPIQPFIENSFYRPVEPFEKESAIGLLKELGFERILKDFLEENAKLDDNFLYLARSGLINFGNEPRPEFTRFQPHMILITNTKVGKTYLFKKITGDLQYQQASPANLLGFGTGKESNEGSLDKEYRTCNFDEITNKGFKEQFADELPSIMENGEAIIGKGKEKIKTVYTGQMVITTNTQGKELYIEDIVQDFWQVIQKLSVTPERIGSRFGFVALADNWRSVESGAVELSAKDIVVNKEIVLYIFKKISKLAGDLIEEPAIWKFLNEKDKKWVELIKEKVEKSKLGKDGRNFLFSFCEGYRHQKGLAFKEGLISYFLENPDELVSLLMQENSYKPNLEELVGIVESEWENIKALQIKTIDKFIETQENKYLTLEKIPAYLKEILKAFKNYILQNRKEDLLKNRLVPFEQLNDYLEPSEGSIYQSISTIIQKMPKNLDRLNRMLTCIDLKIIKKENHYLLSYTAESLDYVEEAVLFG